MNGVINVVETRGVSKRFGPVTVLTDVDLDIRAGEVHALAGGNGAGKSTLMKIIQGVHQPTSGEIVVAGTPRRFTSIQDAKAAGIGMVFQEFSLVSTLTVAQNVFLGVEPRRLGLIDDREAVRRTRTVLDEMQVDLDPAAELGTLGTAYWQLTEIAKALAQDARVLIMDEPTASLAKHETEVLFELIGRLKDRGIAIVYISHRMDEIHRVADRITVLRDGRRLFTSDLASTSPEAIIEGIVGRRIDGGLRYRDRARVVEQAPVVLELRDVSAGPRVQNVSLTVRAGEILGLAGLMGSGRTELARVLFGIDRVRSGEILVRGERVELTSPARAIEAGMALIPEDRRKQGLVLEHSVRDNLLLPLLQRIRRGPLLSRVRGDRLAGSLVERFAIKVADPSRPVRLLSGGNQQKVVLAKWLGTDPSILVLDEPTAGVDIGTKSEILDRIRQLADEGRSVLIISSEYPELLAVSDRVLILRDGRIAADLPREELGDEEALERAVQGV